MNWGAVLLFGWLQVAYLPTGEITIYDNPIPEAVTFAGSFVSELGVEATWGIFYAGGIMRVPAWRKQGELTFVPNQLESTFDAGIKWGGLRIGWSHTCAHAVIPQLGTIQWLGRQVAPRWDSSYDQLYLRIEGGSR